MFCASGAKQYPFRPANNGHFPFSAPPAALHLIEAAQVSGRQWRNLRDTYVAIGTAAKAAGSYGKIQRCYLRAQLGLCAATYLKHERMLLALGVLQRHGNVVVVVHYAQGNSGPAARAAWHAARRAQNAARSRKHYAKHAAAKPHSMSFLPPQVPGITTTQRIITGACAPSPKPKAVLPFKKEILISKHGRRQAATSYQPTAKQKIAMAAARAHAIPHAVLDKLEEELCGPLPTPVAPQAPELLPVPAAAGEALLARLNANADSVDQAGAWPEEQAPTSASITEAAWAEECAQTKVQPGAVGQHSWAQFKRLYPEFAAAQAGPFVAAGFTQSTLVAAAEGVRQRKGVKRNLPGLLLHGCRQRAAGTWATSPVHAQAVL